MEASATRAATPVETQVRTSLALSLSLLLGCAQGRSAESTEQPSPEPSVTRDDRPELPFAPPEVHYPGPDSQEELWLSELGLYVDIAEKQLAPDLIAYEPRYPLWSDGADKLRYLRLPAGASIDNSDPDRWQFPAGTVLFKEFSRAGKRLETRVIARLGEDASETFMGSFVWLDDESDAVLVRDGRANVRDTDHDVPTQKDCGSCHNGEPGRILGFSAVQLADPKPELFSAPPLRYDIPGTSEAKAALGYLHGNCGHCHNPLSSTRRLTPMNLRLSLNDREAGATTIERETFGVALYSFTASDLSQRVVPGAPEQSGLVARMQRRGDDSAMPPLGTKHADEVGLARVRAWITGGVR